MPKKELYMFAIGAGGQGMVYAMMSSYVSDYYVNVLQLPLVFVLLLMLLARVWDAINDPLMGMIADRHTTKWGKMKPYILFAAVPITILTILMYYAPEGLNKTELMVYSAFVYVFWGMFYTMADVPFWSMPNVLTPNAEERSQVISLGRTVNGVGSAVPEVLFFVAGLVLPGLLGTTGVEFYKQQYLNYRADYRAYRHGFLCQYVFPGQRTGGAANPQAPARRAVPAQAHLHLQALDACYADGRSVQRTVYGAGGCGTCGAVCVLHRSGDYAGYVRSAKNGIDSRQCFIH